MLIASTLLIALGLVVALLGFKLFKLLLPLVGLVTGFMVGFLGFQAVAGTGAVSSVMAVLIALVVGVLLALLSFVFFDIAVMVFVIAVGASLFSYLGVVLGLQHDGFLVFLLAVAGGILAGMAAAGSLITARLVVAVTALLGVAYVMVGFMLAVGSVTLDELNDSGVVSTLLRVVDQSFLWFFVWLSGSLIAIQMQKRVIMASAMSRAFEYVEEKPKK